MASTIGPRSVQDATRFTATSPHAASKAPGASASAAAAAAAKATTPTPTTPRPPRVPGETPEQRVRRLRLAHQAAQRAQVDGKDRFVNASRRVLDGAHRFAVTGIVLFTVVAGVVSVYSVGDMLRYNYARRAEWREAQLRLEADSLSAARIAYLKGEATEAQIQLVDEANRAAEASGSKLPPLLAPPEHRTHFEEHVATVFRGEKDKAGMAEVEAEGKGRGVLGLLSGLLGGSKVQNGETQATREASSGTDAGVSNTAGTDARLGVAGAIEDRARTAWDREKDNQRRGGSLDQLGLETGAPGREKRGWRPW